MWPYALNTTLEVILTLSSDQNVGQSQVSSLMVRLTSLTDDELEIKGKRRMLSELKEDVNLELGSQLSPLEAEASTRTSPSSEVPKSVNRMLSRLSSLSKVMDAASKVCNELSSNLSGY